MLFRLRGFQSFDLGMRILPILTALGKIASFFLVLLFCMCAYFTVIVILSDEPWSNSLFSAFTVGLLGEYNFYDILGVTEDEPLHPWHPFQYAAFWIAVFFITVAMLNIFIGIMSSAYESALDKVVEVFVRTRASMGLDYAVLCECAHSALALRGINPIDYSQQYVWFCCHHNEELPASETVFQGISNEVKDLQCMVREATKDVSKDVKDVQTTLGEVTTDMQTQRKSLQRLEDAVCNLSKVLLAAQARAAERRSQKNMLS